MPAIKSIKKLTQQSTAQPTKSNLVLLKPPVDAPCRETIDAIKGLLDAALTGEIVGIAFVTFCRGKKPFYVGTVGESARNPNFTRGALRGLDDLIAKDVNEV